MEDSLRKRHVRLLIALVAILLAMRIEPRAARAQQPADNLPGPSARVSDLGGYQDPEAAAPDVSALQEAPFPDDSSSLPSITPQSTTNRNLWSTLTNNYQGPNLSCNCGPAPGACLSCLNLTPTTTWYTRIDYFHFFSEAHRHTLAHEDGPLFTLGYTRQWGDMRLRLELFGGDVTEHGSILGANNVILAPYTSRTAYYGGRAEYDFFCNPSCHPRIQIVFGLGLRVWERDFGSFTYNNTFYHGIHETWLTMYPYIGIESRRDPNRAWELYGRTRIGVLAWNYEYVSYNPAVSLYPRPGVTFLIEEGVRWGNFTLTGWAETFGWSRSGSHNNYYQPYASFVTVGVKAGWSY